MALRSVVTPWTRQPPPLVGPNPTRRVGAIWVPTDRADRVSRLPVIQGTNGVIKPTAGGMAMSVTGTTNLARMTLRCLNRADKPQDGDFTVWCDYILTTVAGYCFVGRWNTGASASTNDWLLGSATVVGSTVSFGVACGSNIVHAEAAAGAVAGTRYISVGRRVGTTIKVYRIAVQTVTGLPLPGETWTTASTTNAAITTINSNISRSLKIGEIDAGAGNNTGLDVLALGLHPYGMTDEEVFALPYRKWDYLAPQALDVPVTVATSFRAAWARRTSRVIGAGVH